MNNKNILLVEDSKEIYQMVLQSLTDGIINLDWSIDMQKAKTLLSQKPYDLVLLDIQLPDGNGMELCSHIQVKHPETSIFFLTSNTDLSQKVMGFSAGADDYITKPFNPLELKARVDAKLKKVQVLKNSSNVLEWNEIKINKESQQVHIEAGSGFELIDLTALEFKLLLYFANRPGAVIERDTILNDIWGQDIHVYSRSVDTHVSKLRKKLGPVSSIIESVHGAGYKFSAT